MPLLFITRTWHGTGGLQTLSHDLWREMGKEYGKDAILCRPTHSDILGLFLFACRAFFQGLRIGRAGGHIHLGDASLCFLGAWIGIFSGAKVTVTVAGLDIVYPAWWYQLLLRWSIRRMDTVCPISEATADVVRTIGVKEEKIVRIHCGIHTQEVPQRVVSSGTKNIVLLTVCRLVTRKGVDWFLHQVFPLLVAKYPTIQYRIVGEGPEREVIEELIEEWHFGNRVHLLGRVDDQVKNAEMLAADILIVPNIRMDSNMEGFGIVCIEASARGLPVAAARIDGLTDSVREGETGCFFDPEHPAEAAAAIDTMIHSAFDPSAVAKATKAHYDWSVLFPVYRDTVFR